MPETQYHIPALLTQTIDALHIKPDGTYVDLTYGGGGHSRAIIERLGADGKLFGFDQDIEAVRRAIDDSRFTIVHSNFRFLRNFMRYFDVDGVDGILADLGVSFHHFDDASRGFSFRFDGPLDMRMNQSSTVTAAQVVNTYSPDRLADVMKLYGEVPHAGRFARALVKAREESPVTTINRLVETLTPLIDPRRAKKEMACIFQALRMEVNDEMGALREMLTEATELLRPGGRLCIITYHSLEDRMVKNFMRSGNVYGKVDTDLYGRTSAPLRMLYAKPIVPDEAEVEANPRSRSAKLRVAQKL